MKIWIDLVNSPHVNFFCGMIRDLQKDHEVVLTSRPLANTIEMLELYGFSHNVIGRHYGHNKIKKALGFLIRVLQLYIFLKNEGIDVAISHSSFYSPVVARMLNMRCMYLNDNEHAAGNRISFLCADHIILPEFLDMKKVQRQWAKANKIIRYPGVKEGIYLWDYQPGSSGDVKRTITHNKKVIFIRPEPWTAQYYNGKQNFIDDLLVGLKARFTIVLLPRGEVQDEYYRQDKFAGITVSKNTISLADVMENCDLFIGAGGTMTREAAVLGVPTISIYQDKLLDVDRFLIERGLMIHETNPDAEFVTDFLEKTGKKPPDRKLLHKGKEAYELIKEILLNDTLTEESGRC